MKILKYRCIKKRKLEIQKKIDEEKRKENSRSRMGKRINMVKKQKS